MSAERFSDRLAQERRARLQAEQLLALRSEELYAANRKLADHAEALSSQVIEQRAENEILKGVTTKTKAELEKATERAVTAQRRLWDALTATEDGFAIFDRDWRLVAGNPAFFRAFDGVADVAEGASYESILRIAVDEGVVDLEGADPDDWLDRMIGRWEQRPIPRVDIKLWNGAFIRIDDTQTPQGDYVSLAIDITADRRRQRLMRQARDRALSASRAKSNFLANMSHEIRTPMNGVVSVAELLRETELTEEQQLYADTIKSSGEALLVIINDVLDYSKIEAGRLELHPERFDLNALINEIFRLLRPGLQDKPIELRLDYDIFLPSRIIADPGRVRQILMNLIGNAIKFTAKGHVTVHVMAGPDETPPGQISLRIVVEDTGFGIPEDKQSHIFGEFNQVESGRNRHHDGTGLGLAITRRLVGLMNGQIWLNSRVGEGSSFGFDLVVGTDADCLAGPVAGLPRDRARVLIVGRSTPQLERLLEDLARLHAEPMLIRRLPEARDLDGVSAVFVSNEEDAQGVSEALDANGFSGACLSLIEQVPGFKALEPGAGLAALRQVILSESQGLAPPDPEPAPRLRLLAAEDNKTNQLVFKTMLKGLNIDLEIVDDGAALVDAFRRGRPDLIMTDISMPGLDGIEAARQIRGDETAKKAKPVPMIAMTAHALEGDRERILEAGLDDYITKPLKKGPLRDKIVAYLGPEILPD